MSSHDGPAQVVRPLPEGAPRKPRSSVAFSFGSPADDSGIGRIDLNDILIRHAQATFLMRVAGSAMREAGIDDGDLVLVDRAIDPAPDHVVIAIVDEGFVCRRLVRRGARGSPARGRCRSARPRDRRGQRAAGVGRGHARDQVAAGLRPVLALVDVNNMYVSCERVFRPALARRPVVVLSHNDGVCVARSNEAKDLGVEMAQPWFQVRHLQRQAGLVALSANFELYGDMSNRMMTLAAGYAPRQEIYSIDECFLDFDGVRGDLARVGRELRAQVLQWTGLPTSVGLGRHQDAGQAGQPRGQDGRAQARQLSARAGAGVRLRRAVGRAARGGDARHRGRRGVGHRPQDQRAPARGRRALGARRDARRPGGAAPAVQRGAREARCSSCAANACLGVDDAPEANQQIMCSRSFGEPVMSLREPDRIGQRLRVARGAEAAQPAQRGRRGAGVLSDQPVPQARPPAQPERHAGAQAAHRRHAAARRRGHAAAARRCSGPATAT